MKKKVAMTVELQVRLTESELAALQQHMEQRRTPTVTQVKKHFEQVIDDALDEVIEANPPPEPDDE